MMKVQRMAGHGMADGEFEDNNGGRRRKNQWMAHGRFEDNDDGRRRRNDSN